MGKIRFVLVAIAAVVLGLVVAAPAHASGGVSWTQVPNYQPADSVSCPSLTFCAAVSNAGSIETFRAGSWHQDMRAPDLGCSDQTDPGTGCEETTQLASVSCTSASFCVAAGSSYLVASNENWDITTVSYLVDVYAVWNGVAWKGGPAMTGTGLDNTPLDPGQQLSQVSCASATFCLATDRNADLWKFDGTRWSAPKAYGGPIAAPANMAVFSVSCSTDGSCAALGSAGRAVVYAGGHWGSVKTILPTGTSTVGCVSRTFCLAASRTGQTVTWNGTSWSSPHQATRTKISDIDCPTASLCFVTTGGGTAIRTPGDHYQNIGTPSTKPLSSAACRTTKHCYYTITQPNFNVSEQ
jgi:hypothetical protein